MSLLALALVAVAALSAAQAPARPAAADAAVYQAVLAHRIRPEVIRRSQSLHVVAAAPVLVGRRSVPLCNPRTLARRTPGCVQDERLRLFDADSKAPIAGRIAAPTRGELTADFRARNDDSHDLALAGLAGVIPFALEEVDAAQRREATRTRGFAMFSRPAYSTDGHALVYASYWCGNMCGYGWWFLLERPQDTAWRVVDEHLIWIS